jgi:hypothetical protein
VIEQILAWTLAVLGVIALGLWGLGVFDAPVRAKPPRPAWTTPIAPRRHRRKRAKR